MILPPAVARNKMPPCPPLPPLKPGFEGLVGVLHCPPHDWAVNPLRSTPIVHSTDLARSKASEMPWSPAAGWTRLGGGKTLLGLGDLESTRNSYLGFNGAPVVPVFLFVRSCPILLRCERSVGSRYIHQSDTWDPKNSEPNQKGWFQDLQFVTSLESLSDLFRD